MFCFREANFEFSTGLGLWLRASACKVTSSFEQVTRCESCNRKYMQSLNIHSVYINIFEPYWPDSIFKMTTVLLEMWDDGNWSNTKHDTFCQMGLDAFHWHETMSKPNKHLGRMSQTHLKGPLAEMLLCLAWWSSGCMLWSWCTCLSVYAYTNYIHS